MKEHTFKPQIDNYSKKLVNKAKITKNKENINTSSMVIERNNKFTELYNEAVFRQKKLQY